MENKVRTFVAIELPPEVRQALSDVRAALEQEAKALGVGGELALSARWVRPEGTHLTLKFLGWTPEAQLAQIEAGVRRACAGRHPFQLRLCGVGAFPSLQRGRVLWIGLDGDLSSLTAIQSQLEGELAPLGYPTEARPFHPHLTLARLERGLPEELSRALAGKFEVPGREWMVDGLSLMRSELLRGGARYTQLAFAQLEGAEERAYEP
ncbi:MAG: RNA 2',3'-cyclic phosphodiesterase [Actinobacteria bacterium]|nr:RNA 2',3'-cyclic phosphodiesterase [Actinomycetota bacterium]